MNLIKVPWLGLVSSVSPEINMGLLCKVHNSICKERSGRKKEEKKYGRLKRNDLCL